MLTPGPVYVAMDTVCVNITLLDDEALEGNQTFTVTLTTNPEVELGNDVTTITITDDDGNLTPN